MKEKRAILIVDDEAVLLMAIRQELRLAMGPGYLFETALNAEGGLKSLEELEGQGVEVALVISDWLMPGMRGDDFLRIVHSRHPAIRLVLLSGHADPEQMDRLSGEIGLSACLSKPYARGALTCIVREALG
jgi:DNA-binding NtrC family response regulator